jgi:asparagine synthase (glutamine-hydrolysing)
MPFMDWRLVSYVFSLPTESKIGEGFTKLLVRKAMKGKIDESLRTRTYKVGISSPIDNWLNNSLRSWAADMINDNRLREELNKGNTLNSEQVKKIWQEINLKLILS